MKTSSISAYLNYIIVAVVSVVMLLFLPFLGSEIGLAFTFPDTAAGWVVYIITKAITAVANLLLFHCFLSQAKVNVKGDERYIKAREMMRLCPNQDPKAPIAPEKWVSREYAFKGTAIFITTLISAFCLAQAILTFDFVTFFTYLLTIIFGIISGIIEMKKAEEIWTDGYLEYATYIQE